MSKETGVLAAGLLVFLTPFLGVPGSWRTVILIILGAAIAIMGFLLRGQSLGHAPRIKNSSASRSRSQQAFVESPIQSLPDEAHESED
jgi:hypothetical protein